MNPFFSRYVFVYTYSQNTTVKHVSQCKIGGTHTYTRIDIKGIPYRFWTDRLTFFEFADGFGSDHRITFTFIASVLLWPNGFPAKLFTSFTLPVTSDTAKQKHIHRGKGRFNNLPPPPTTNCLVLGSRFVSGDGARGLGIHERKKMLKKLCPLVASGGSKKHMLILWHFLRVIARLKEILLSWSRHHSVIFYGNWCPFAHEIRHCPWFCSITLCGTLLRNKHIGQKPRGVWWKGNSVKRKLKTSSYQIRLGKTHSKYLPCRQAVKTN